MVQACQLSPIFWKTTIRTYGGREGKCGFRVQSNTRSVNKATQRTITKQSFYCYVFFIKYVITVILMDEVVNIVNILNYNKLFVQAQFTTLFLFD